jgi:hypothetical protein
VTLESGTSVDTAKNVNLALDVAQAGLMLAGNIPGLGVFANGTNAVVSLARGNNLDAAMYAGAAVLSAVAPGGALAAEAIEESVVAVKAGESTATTFDMLSAAAEDATRTAGPGSGGAYGTRVHSIFADTVRSFENPDLVVERNWINQGYGGGLGSVRPDVVELGASGLPENVYDLKTGSATIKAAWEANVRVNVPNGGNLTFYTVKP